MASSLPQTVSVPALLGPYRAHGDFWAMYVRAWAQSSGESAVVRGGSCPPIPGTASRPFPFWRSSRRRRFWHRMRLRHVPTRGKSEPARRPFHLRVALACGPLCLTQKKGLSREICDTLTPGNSRVAFSPLRGSFVSPMRDVLSACVSTYNQQTLAMQIDALHAFATRCGWTVMDRHPQCRPCSKPLNNASSM
jgi:hypothetical protein